MEDDVVFYRTSADSDLLRPRGIEFLHRLEQLLPPGQFRISYETLYIGRTDSDEVGWVAVALVGFQRAVAPLEFEFGDDPEMWAEALVRWRTRHIAEVTEVGSRPA